MFRIPRQFTGPITWMALSATAVAFGLSPGSPLRSAVGGRATAWLTSHRAARDWIEISDVRERRGRPAVHIVEFVDYSCAFCKQSEPALDAFQNKWRHAGIGIRFISRKVLEGSDRRALLAVCADDRFSFPAVHRIFFDDRAAAAIRDLDGLASVLGVSALALEACFNDEKNVRALDNDIHWAEILGIRTTPTFVGPAGIHRGIASIGDLERIAGRANLAHR